MKKGAAILVSAMILGSSLVNGVMLTSANNHTDTSFDFQGWGDGGDLTIGVREKQDTTASYLKLNAGCADQWTSVAGTNNSSSTPVFGAHVCSGNVTVQGGNYRYVSNTVHQSGYKFAYFIISSDNGKLNRIAGKWSPDNISGRY